MNKKEATSDLKLNDTRPGFPLTLQSTQTQIKLSKLALPYVHNGRLSIEKKRENSKDMRCVHE